LPRINTAQKVKDTVRNLLTRICGGRPKVNELTKRDMKLALDAMLRKKLALPQGKYMEVEDFSNTMVVYSVWDDRNGDRELLKREIRVDGLDRIELGDAEVSVTRRTEYIPTTNSRIIENNKKENDMEAKIDKLIAADNQWTDADKSALMKMNEVAIDEMLGDAPKTNCKCQEKAPAPAPAPAVNTDKGADKPLTKEDVASIVAETLTKSVPALKTTKNLRSSLV
jgi:hypothetical protein